ncbi:MAG TPA: endonuclease/exonuclease/phosphatase family protein [bacterium]|nr:endonuclease/exonuclease/phosphatase family protein [bacterium]
MNRRAFYLALLFTLTILCLTACNGDDDDDDNDVASDDDSIDDDSLDDDASDDDATDDDAIDDDTLDDDTTDDDTTDDDTTDDDTGDDDTTEPETIKAMSFNLRTGLAADGENSWVYRKGIVAASIEQEMPDVMGVQEALIFQLTYIEQNVPGYAWVGRSRRLLPDEYSAVFYRTDKFELIDQSTFWLSDSPEVVGSQFSDDQLCPRIVTWAELASLATGRHFFVFNTHWDTYQGDEVHQRSAALMVEQIAEIAGDAPVLATGDFNEAVDGNGYRILTGAASYQGASGVMVDPWITLEIPDEGTYHRFTGVPTGSSRIDWVLYTAAFTPFAAEVSHYNQEGRYPSDHFPVFAEFSLEEE